MPPYSFIDKATGKPVVTDGVPWENMDVAPGKHIEIFSADTDGYPRISPGSLERPADAVDVPPVDPPPVDPPPTTGGGNTYNISITGGSLPLITREDDLNALLNAAAVNRYVLELDGRSRVAQTKPISIQQPGNSGMPWGINGNYAQINWNGPGGLDMLTFRGNPSGGNRGLVIEKLGLDGNGYNKAACGSCIKISAPDGDKGSIYKFTVRDVYTMYGTVGFWLEGAVFEGLMENFHGENHASHGFYTKNMTAADGAAAYISNIMMVNPNLSRNLGAGMMCDGVSSINVILGSFILNALGAIVTTNGLRVCAFNNAENSGETAFAIPANGYGSLILANEGSSDGNTRARKFTNGAWVDVGKPMLYTVSIGPGVVQANNLMSYYGGQPNLTRVVK